MIDNKGRLFGKISVIDIFVIVIISLIIIFGLFRVGSATSISILDIPELITIDFTVADLEPFTLNMLSLNDEAMDNNTNVSFGNVINIRVEELIEYNQNRDGVLVASARPDRHKVTVTSQFMGHLMPNGVWVEGNTYLMGQQVVLRVGYTNIFGMITAIY
ncbi:MAG: DUF4330 domain-containing protein [Defluviitaleaceae bacterium]|nr:DUF4330 domain-containing protein [Defluviitaleaceae bacterium]